MHSSDILKTSLVGFVSKLAADLLAVDLVYRRQAIISHNIICWRIIKTMHGKKNTLNNYQRIVLSPKEHQRLKEQAQIDHLEAIKKDLEKHWPAFISWFAQYFQILGTKADIFQGKTGFVDIFEHAKDPIEVIVIGQFLHNKLSRPASQKTISSLYLDQLAQMVKKYSTSFPAKTIEFLQEVVEYDTKSLTRDYQSKAQQNKTSHRLLGNNVAKKAQDQIGMIEDKIIRVHANTLEYYQLWLTRLLLQLVTVRFNAGASYILLEAIIVCSLADAKCDAAKELCKDKQAILTEPELLAVDQKGREKALPVLIAMATSCIDAALLEIK